MYFESDKIYYKITNKDEHHYNFKYVTGLNILRERFDDNPNDTCCSGGFYFTDINHIFRFLDYGIYLREIILPHDNSLRFIQDKSRDKWRANMIIFGKRRNLSDINTFKHLVECGADIHIDNDRALRWSIENGYIDIFKYLIENRASINNINLSSVLINSLENGHTNMVKFIINNYKINISTLKQSMLRLSIQTGNLDLVKYFIENGANIHYDNDSVINISRMYVNNKEIKFPDSSVSIDSINQHKKYIEILNFLESIP